MKQNIQISFDWHLTNNCNFNCIYCHPQIKAVLNKNQKINYSFEQILNAFENINKTCHIYMSGGEPFLFPNFIEFCKKITKKHYISINTNLSIPQIVQFVESINPKHVVGIYAALHILERERLNIPVKKFISDVLMLQQKGFNITVFYVLYPPLIDRFSEDAKILRDSGIKYVAGKIFKGVYKGKLYPDNYSSDEKGR